MPNIHLLLIPHLPKEEPCSKQWFTQRLTWIMPYKPHIPQRHTEVAMHFPFTFLVPKPIIILSEVTSTHNLIKKEFPFLLIHRSNHLLLFQSKHLMQHKHHRPCKLPQSQPFQIPLQRSQILRIQIRETCEICVPLHNNKIIIKQLSQSNPFRKQMPIQMRKNIDGIE